MSNPDQAEDKRNSLWTRLLLANQYEMEPKETIGELTSDIKYVTRIEKARKGGSGLLFIGLLDPEHLSFSFH